MENDPVKESQIDKDTFQSLQSNRDRSYLREEEISKDIQSGKFSILDLNNKLSNLQNSLDSVKENIKDLTINARAREALDIDNRTKVTNIETKFTYFQSELSSSVSKIDSKLEGLTDSKGDYKRDISIINEKIVNIVKDIENIKEQKRIDKNNMLTYAAIISGLVAAIMTGIIDRLKL